MEFFEGYNLLEKSFFICAVAGGLGFVISTLTQFMSSGHDFDSSGDGFDSVDHDGTLSDSDVSFKFLSFQGIASFLLMFGLVGLAISITLDLHAVWSIVGGTISGMIAVKIIQSLFSVFKNLQSSGTLNLNNVVGAQGVVYLEIPSMGVGKVEVVVNNRTYVLPAVIDQNESSDASFTMGQRVEVVKIQAGRNLSVKTI